jgi:tripartite-type tricarboxylate transporter receptor subunit TctC
MTFTKLFALASALVIAGLQSALAADTYPTRPIRMVVGFAAGGATDVFARIVGQKLTERLGQQIVVDNRTGAGGSLGTALVAKAPADGYTLAVISASHAINASLYKSLPFDAVTDFAPVAPICGITNVLAVTPALPAHTVAELIALARAKPGAINFASGGIGSSSHLAGELFKSMAGINIVHVPYKGTADALRDLVSGQVQSTVDAISALLPFINKGALRALGVGDAKRMALLPDVPTIAEAGLPGYEYSALVGLLAPAGTPRETIRRLNAEINSILRQPEIGGRFTEMGARPMVMTPDEFARMIKSDVAKFARIIKSAGVQPQ